MIHPSAIIHPTAKVHETARIDPYAIIGEDCVIGAGVHVAPYAVIEFTEIGENTKIHTHAVVGSSPQDLKYKGEKTKLIIGKNCTIREFAQINRATIATGKTVIGDDCYIMAFTHIAHDVRVGNGVIMVNGATLAGHVEVGDHVVLGGLCAVHQFCRVGTLAMIGGGAMVNQDVIPFAQAQGDRARLVGLNLVGLKRKGYKLSDIEEIKSAYRSLFLSGLTVQDAVEQLEASDPSAEVRSIVAFIRSSKRGIAHHGRKEAVNEL